MIEKLKFQSVFSGRGRVASWVPPFGASGVYVVKECGLLGRVLYVGESHTGRLRKTLLRHLQHWKGKTAGPVYRRGSVIVATVKTSPASARSIQNALILEYSEHGQGPRDNTEGNRDFWA